MTARTIALTDNAMRPTVQHVLLALAAVSALSLGGCAKIDMPTTMTEKQIVLESDNHTQTYKVADLKAAQFNEIGEHFRRHGNGQAEVIVSYDPYSKKNTAMKATDHLQRITTELGKRGVGNIKGSILAADYSGDAPEMIIGYSSVSAQPPEDCRLMPGAETMRAELDFDYKLGCSIRTMVSRQVARPADLAGRSPDSANGDARRAGIIVESYRAGDLDTDLNAAYSTE